ncbi:hypothetical protein Cni_G08197 [Canna indica]|uniref:YABBY2 n=1 Tax=Canna indica TaxID=4628 RepID=A0AAQ3K5E2_9LILI|nr:hypothetical protein Cni_G08197 [Canna indica]
MSTQEHICYVHCNLCNTILAVSVPGNSMLNSVTVRCGHCSNLLSVNMGSLFQTLPLQDFQIRNIELCSQEQRMECGSPSNYTRPQMLPMPPPGKRQRVPSAYNRFIKEEIQRIKANNPDISHREAFSTAAKNWAHFPHIQFGLTFDSNKQEKADEAVVAPGSHQSFF